MGQKIHPTGFRLSLNENFLSKWFSNNKNYNIFLKEDFFIRENIESIFSSLLIISKIQINRNNNCKNNKEITFIEIKCKLNELELNNFLINFFFKINAIEFNELLLNNLNKIIKFILKKKIELFIKLFQLKFNKLIKLNILFIKNEFEDAVLIANYISIQIKNRIPYRRVIKQTIKQIQSLTKINGIKIQISGRLNGIEIARTEWKQIGKTPLHTLNINIDYISYPVKTIYGLIGIKIWLFK